MHPVEALLTPLGKLLGSKHADPSAGLAARLEPADPGRIALSAPAFADGGEIPARYCGRFIGENVSPALNWGEPPAGTAALLLVIEDLDVPTTVPGIHLIAQLAPCAGVPDGALNAGAPGVEFLPNHRGIPGYIGPRPLPGHGPHHYVFHLYALDSRLDFAGIADRARLPDATARHVLASGTLTGTRTS